MTTKSKRPSLVKAAKRALKSAAHAPAKAKAKGPAEIGCRYIGTEEIPLDAIRPSPYQPRLEISTEDLAPLAAVIAKVSFLDAVWVREICPDPCPPHRTFELLDGERRWRAARIAAETSGLKTLRGDVFQATDAQARQMALLSVLHREDLSPIERATAYQHMLTAGDYPDQKALAVAMGVDQSTVSNLLRLLKLPEDWRRRIISREISERHARALLPFTKFPTIVAAFDEFFVLNLEQSENCRELPTVAEWEEEIVPRIVKDATRSMDGMHGDRMTWHPRYGRVSIFEPDAFQEKQLKILKFGGEHLATNVELWEELQAKHLEEIAKCKLQNANCKLTEQAETTEAAVKAHTDEEGDEDLSAFSLLPFPLFGCVFSLGLIVMSFIPILSINEHQQDAEPSHHAHRCKKLGMRNMHLKGVKEEHASNSACTPSQNGPYESILRTGGSWRSHAFCWGRHSHDQPQPRHGEREEQTAKVQLPCQDGGHRYGKQNPRQEEPIPSTTSDQHFVFAKRTLGGMLMLRQSNLVAEQAPALLKRIGHRAVEQANQEPPLFRLEVVQIDFDLRRRGAKYDASTSRSHSPLDINKFGKIEYPRPNHTVLDNTPCVDAERFPPVNEQQPHGDCGHEAIAQNVETDEEESPFQRCRAHAEQGHHHHANKANQEDSTQVPIIWPQMEGFVHFGSSHQARHRHGTTANTLAGNPEPPLGFGNVATTIAPVSGTLSRFISSSIW